VNISSFGGIQYALAVAYGVGKEAVDRMAADMALELKPQGITCISLWPGLAQTEFVVADRKNFPESGGTVTKVGKFKFM
jgi:NAD(P)-dependent dehydrogenase (short-subunit alcohol dehydrogenase family)